MLRPFACLACEKVLHSLPGDTDSLIVLFDRLTIAVPEEQDIPKNAVAPKEWAIYSAWDPEPGDEIRNYFLCTQILYPDQTQFGETMKSKMRIEANKRSKVNTQVLGFPVGQPGFYTVRMWLEEHGKQVFGPLEFKIELEIVRQSAAAHSN
jgi:hypothetical protein